MTRIALINPDGTTTVGGVLCKIVPVDIVADAIVSLGAFVSDEGWSQGDMDNFDRLCAFKVALSALPELPTRHKHRQVNTTSNNDYVRGLLRGWNACLDAIAPGSAPTEGKT